MENHPIPQDVTGFQFKLIGSMTIREFLYLLAGTISAWIFYSLPIMLIIKFPLVLLSFSSGFAFAFLPLEGRPLDVMLSHFVKALFTPNQYVYTKTGGVLILDTGYVVKAHQKPPSQADSSAKLKALLTTLSPSSHRTNDLDPKEASFIQNLFGQQLPQPPQQTQPLPFQKEEQKTVQLEAENAQTLEKQLEEEEERLKQELTHVHQMEKTKEDPSIHQKAAELEKILQITIAQKEKLEQELVRLKSHYEQKQSTIYTPTQSGQTVPAQSAHVRTVPKGMGKSVGLPIASEAANVITGVVKDPRGTILPNILVEVKDNQGNPVRAFKTNTLGQFASATALTNGIYTIEFEDPKKTHRFDTVQIEAKGKVILPLEVLSIDQREELRISLFGG